ncbi:MAG: carboxypeptidase-like regulatory domain-containing protein [Clostridiales bacterium]
MNLPKFFKASFRLIILAVFLCHPLYAGGGKLTGKVVDKKTGEPLGFANVVITHVIQNGKEVRLSMPMGAQTESDGYFVILNIAPGEYSIRTSVVGYNSVVVKEVKIDPDRTITLNFDLDPTSIELNEIVINAKREVIKADVSSTQELISSEKLSSLPVIRVDEYLGKLKGIELASTSDGYGLQVRGGAIRETDVRMDGISLQDPRSGNSYLGFNSTTVNEIQVLTGGFEAKYGGIRSGLLDVKTKDGSREKFTVAIKTDYTPEGQYRFFGTNPFSNDSWIYKIYSGQYAFTGAPNDENVPSELSDFKGWKKTISPVAMKALDSLQKYDLWKLQHPQYGVANRPDFNIEGTITGPFPLPYTAFMAAFKYQNQQYALPIGPRDDYTDWNAQLKLTTNLEKMKFSVNGMYARVLSNTIGASVSYDESQRFSYMNNSSRDAVSRQLQAISGTSFMSLWNKSRFQYFEQTFGMGGAKFTYVPKQNLFYSLEFQMGYTGQDISPMMMNMNADSSQNYVRMYSKAAKSWYTFTLPTSGVPNGTTLLSADGMGKFNMYGGGQWADSSYSYNYQLKGELTWQIDKHNEFQAGFNAGMQDINVYAGYWNQSVLAYTPNSWQYYKATPLDIGLYVQDKLEFEGLILNAGLRLDYFNSMKKKYEVGFPEDGDYRKFYTDIYSGLDGSYNSYERWLLFRDMISNPPGWPEADNPVQVKLSPRLGVSFPITETSKMYFNYGYFYQRPATSILYNMKLNSGSTTIPTPDMNMARTVSYEFGYEQSFLEDFLFNITAYYKDVSDEPLSRTFIDYYETNQVTKYYPDAYSDTRGVELRLERNVGKFVTFSAMYDYMIKSSGKAGYETIYENLAKYRENAIRKANQTTPIPQPRANVNLNLHTPEDYGMIWGSWMANIFFEWKDGGQVLLNSDQTLKSLQQWIDVVNYWNIDFKLSKELSLANSTFELYVTIQNLTNNKWLNTSNFNTAQSSAYRRALQENGGKWGEYEQDYLANTLKGGWEFILFQNPRRISIGARVNL